MTSEERAIPMRETDKTNRFCLAMKVRIWYFRKRGSQPWKRERIMRAVR
jgi:hypothetical protein